MKEWIITDVAYGKIICITQSEPRARRVYDEYIWGMNPSTDEEAIEFEDEVEMEYRVVLPHERQDYHARSLEV